MNLMEDKKHLYTEKYKTLLRGIHEDQNNWEISFVHASEDLMLSRFLFFTA